VSGSSRQCYEVTVAPAAATRRNGDAAQHFVVAIMAGWSAVPPHAPALRRLLFPHKGTDLRTMQGALGSCNSKLGRIRPACL